MAMRSHLKFTVRRRNLILLNKCRIAMNLLAWRKQVVTLNEICTKALRASHRN